ncbi:MAG TPA: hypothetical protein VL738_08250, partial [Dactylosporangium sp.]|nr:hypothetical protein [Dactylosporangium sp.]
MSFLPSPIPHPLAWWHDAPGWVLEGLNWVVGVQWPAGNEKLTWDLADTWYGAGKDLTPAIDAFTQGGPDASLGFGGLASDIGTQIDAIWRAYANDPETGLRYLQTVLHEIGQLVDGTACDIESAKIEMYVEIGFMIVELIMLAAAAFATFGTAAAAEPAAMAAGRFAISRIFKQLLKKVVERAAKKAAKEALEAAAKKVSKEGLKRLLKDAGKHALREGAEEVATEFAVESSQMARGHRDGGFDLLALGFSALGGGVGGAFGGLAGLGPNVKNKAGHFFESLGRGAAGEMIAETGANLATGQGLPSLANLGMAGTSGMRSGLTDHVTEGLNDRTHDKLLDIGARLDATSAAVSAPSDAMAALAQPTRDPDVTGPPGGITATGTTFTDAAYPGDGVHNGAPGQTVASGADDTVSNGQSGYVTTVSTHTGGGSTDLAGLATTSSPATVSGSGVDTVPASTHTASPGGVTGGGTVAVAPTGVAPTGLAPTGLAQTTAPTGLAPATAPTGFTPTTAPAGLTATTAPTGPAPTTAPTGPASTTAPTGPAQVPVSSPGTSVAPGHTGAPPAVAPSQPTGASTVPGSPHGTTAAAVLVPGGTPTGGEPPGTASHHTPAQSRTDATASRLDAARRREALAQQHRDQNLRERDQQYQTAQRKLDDSLQRWMDARQRHDPTADRIADQEVVPAR